MIRIGARRPYEKEASAALVAHNRAKNRHHVTTTTTVQLCQVLVKDVQEAEER